MTHTNISIPQLEKWREKLRLIERLADETDSTDWRVASSAFYTIRHAATVILDEMPKETDLG